MAAIKLGYGDKPLHISVYTEKMSDMIYIDIRQQNSYKAKEYGEDKAQDETLAYATIEEVIKLRDEINKALQDRIGV